MCRIEAARKQADWYKDSRNRTLTSLSVLISHAKDRISEKQNIVVFVFPVAAPTALDHILFLKKGYVK